MMKKNAVWVLMLLLAKITIAQTISGTITSGGKPVANASIVANPSKLGASASDDGKYTLKVPAGTYKITVSAVGYASTSKSVTVAAGQDQVLDVALEAATSNLNEVVVTGMRSVPRSSTSTPLPADNLDAGALKAVGQPSFDKALQYRVPAFNSVNLPVQDATSLLDPYEIRNMGPSRTLVLINGKRKNVSSLIYVQNTPGKGETGADLSAIPMAAIKNVEILRDGASAQYGSDAIAGVINITLKDKTPYTEATIQSGITSKGDGAMGGLSINTGSTFANGGFINFTSAFQTIEKTNRSTNVDLDADLASLGSPADRAIAQAFLAKYPDAKNINGTPSKTTANFVMNMAIPVGENSQVYANAAYVYKNVGSFANYRTPYWKKDPDFLLHAAGSNYEGFGPTFQGNMNDYNGTIGYKTTTPAGWKTDMSLTVGGNRQIYSVSNTYNEALGSKSPTSFKPGGFAFNHIVGNMDASKSLTDNLSIAIGSEIRSESYQIIAGDTASYSGSGAISFPGFSAGNAQRFTRFNLGGYFDVSWEATKNLLINGTVRGEKYSDFGNNLVWKASARYKLLGEKLTVRGSVATGFKAPSLHQIGLSLNQATFANSTVVVEGLLNNSSTVVKQLGVPTLKAEKATNITAGVAFAPDKHFTITVDYYNIAIKDRIVLSSRVTGPGTNSLLDQTLASSGVRALSFFINGVDTRTQGVDVVANYRNLAIASKWKMNVNFAGNYNSAVRTGSIKTPALLSGGSPIFNRTEEAIMLTSRPKLKFVIGADLMFDNKLTVSLNGTYFGANKFVNTALANSDASADDPLSGTYSYLEFKPKMVADLNLNYKFSKMVDLSLAVNNILNIVPEYTLKNLGSANEQTVRNALDFNGRYRYTSYDASHFAIQGTTFQATLAVRM